MVNGRQNYAESRGGDWAADGANLTPLGIVRDSA